LIFNYVIPHIMSSIRGVRLDKNVKIFLFFFFFFYTGFKRFKRTGLVRLDSPDCFINPPEH